MTPTDWAALVVGILLLLFMLWIAPPDCDHIWVKRPDGWCKGIFEPPRQCSKCGKWDNT